MQPDNFLAAGRRSGARFLVYGGIHKMSTLIQWGDVELLDLETNKLLLKRTVTFRGDTDEAFSRAGRLRRRDRQGRDGEEVRDQVPRFLASE